LVAGLPRRVGTGCREEGKEPAFPWDASPDFRVLVEQVSVWKGFAGYEKSTFRSIGRGLACAVC
jgi:hypothetical protein